MPDVVSAAASLVIAYIATSRQMSFANIFRSARGLSQPPIDDIETDWSPAEKAQPKRMLARSIVGSLETVRAGVEALIAETQADELIVLSDVQDRAPRLRSSEMIAEVAGATQAPSGRSSCRQSSRCRLRAPRTRPRP